VPLDTVNFVAFAAPLELAAAQAYQAAIDGGKLDAEWAGSARDFLQHHQDVATALTGLIPASVTDPPVPVPDPELVSGPVAAVTAAGDQTAALTALAGIEDTLAASHLAALGEIDEPITAKAAAQALATTSQHVVALGRAIGTDVATLTPPVATTDGAREPGN
jgi:hypothetical protein